VSSLRSASPNSHSPGQGSRATGGDHLCRQQRLCGDLGAHPIFQQNPNDLSKVFVRSSAGLLVPLSTVATLTQVAGPLTINHQGQLLAVTISFNLAPGVALGEAIGRIEDMERRLVFPPTITAGFSGTAQVFQPSVGTS
jgi:multidrug efflux pump subunit AcrB